MTECELVRNKRCEECIRPLCQRSLSQLDKWDDISLPIVNEYKMIDLFLG